MLIQNDTVSIAAIDEIIVSFTNVVRRSQYGQAIFPHTYTGQLHFDAWQSDLLKSASNIYTYWLDNSTKTEDALDAFESSLKAIFPTKNNPIQI